MFTSARIKLTAIYTLLIVLISGTMSVLFYQRTTRVLEFEYQRLRTRMEMEFQGFVPPMPPRMHKVFDIEDLNQAKMQILWQLIKVNGLIVIIFSVGGYWLSGLTLNPIKKAMAEQSRFIGDAAHELKTPIAGLKTSLEVNLMDKDLSSETKKILKENLADVTSLQNLSENLLALARSTDQPIQMSEVSISQLIDQAIRHVKPLAIKKKIVIRTVGILDEMKGWAQESLLLELLLILLDNAIKYSDPKTSIVVNVTEDRKHIFITVIDQGAGIAKEDIPHIFDRFYRADKSRTKSDVGGYGLGLSVAKKIIDQINGAITVNSEIGQGSTFTVRLDKVH